MSDVDNRRALIAAARETARGMAAAVADRDGDCRVTLKGAQFRVIATLLAELATAADADAACSCMGQPIDGVRFWVPQAQLASERARADQLAREVAGLRDAIRFSGDLVSY